MLVVYVACAGERPSRSSPAALRRSEASFEEDVLRAYLAVAHAQEEVVEIVELE